MSLHNEQEREIPVISTGQPSTLKTYREIALIMNGMEDSSRAVKFIDAKIAESPNGENEIVIAPETQMIHVLGSMTVEEIRAQSDGDEPVEGGNL